MGALPTVTSLLKVTLVARFAPARQTSPKGTTAPQIARPRTAGLEYSMVMSVSPTVWVTFALGLRRGSSSCWANAGKATVSETIADETASFRRMETSMGIEHAAFLVDERQRSHGRNPHEV